jgi:hypothetical protein
MAAASTRAAVRRAVLGAQHRLRSVDATARVLPDFLVIGAQKAGTTSLYAYLSTHPDILPAAHKEIHYFDLNYGEGERWYRAMFPTRRRIATVGRDGSRRVVTGEASPYYLFHPLAAARAAQTLPDARLIVLLRDPVQRAWSHYRHEVRAGRERLGFADALAAEPARLAGAEAALRAGLANAATVAHRTSSYIARGRYAQQLRRWLEHYPRESLLVVQAEDLFEAPVREFGRVVAHLGVVGMAQPRFEVFNAGRVTTPMDPDVQAELTAVFREPNAELADLLGIKLSWPARVA